MGYCGDYINRMSVNLRSPCEKTGKVWDEMVPMSDGIRLHTLFYMPDTNGPWPVLFSRSPYPKNQEIYDYQGKIFSERGYGFVVQYCRGTEQSEGNWNPFENEQKDGVDALRWLAARGDIQSIGLYGFSYVGFTQWIVLDQLPKKVKTAYIVHFGTDRYRQMYSDGLFRHDIYTPWAMDNSEAGIGRSYSDAWKAGLYKPHICADREVWGMELPWYKEWISHPDYDEYWKNSFWEKLKQIPGKINIPICIGLGWYDHHFGGMMEAYQSFSKFSEKHSRMVIGPWEHMKHSCIEACDTSGAFSEGLQGYEGALCWFDKILKEENYLPDAEVIAYEVRDGWRKFETWPPKSKNCTWYFAEGKLKKNMETDCKPITYVYNPGEPVYTQGAECMCYAPLEERGSRKQNMTKRQDVLHFFSEEAEEDLSIAGSIRINLYVSTDAKDTTFVVRVMETAPDGTSCNIRTGAMTLRYRNGAEKSLEYHPGDIVKCEFKLWDIFWKLPKGYRLRIDVQSSSFPEYNIHYNTAEPWAAQKESVVARQNIWIGGDTPSSVTLPIEIKKEEI